MGKLLFPDYSTFPIYITLSLYNHIFRSTKYGQRHDKIILFPFFLLVDNHLIKKLSETASLPSWRTVCPD